MFKTHEEIAAMLNELNKDSYMTDDAVNNAIYIAFDEHYEDNVSYNFDGEFNDKLLDVIESVQLSTFTEDDVQILNYDKDQIEFRLLNLPIGTWVCYYNGGNPYVELNTYDL